MTDRKVLDTPFALKFADDATGAFSGYASTFGGPPDSFGDIIEPGAFSATIAEWTRTGRYPPMLWQHDADAVIGTWTEIREDRTGLAVTGRLALDVQQGREAYALLKMGALSGLSIGYSTEEARAEAKRGVRRLIRVKLHEISLVTMPANERAQVSVVKAADRIRTIRDFEDFLRQAGGFSHAAAKAIASHGYRPQPDPRDEDAAMAELLASLNRALASASALHRKESQ